MKTEIEKIYNEFVTLKVTLRKQCEDEIINLLNSVEGKRVKYDCEDDDEQPYVSYDGGNHPEYASNCFSAVRSVFLDDKGGITLDIDDVGDYEIDRLWDVDEVMDILSFVEWKVNKR